MGIDKISAAANYQNQAVQSTQVNKVSVQTSDTATQDTVSGSTAGTASAVQLTNTQKSGTDNGESNLAQQNEKKEATIKDLKDIQKVINNNTVAEFGYNEPTNRITIKIKDRDTDEVIKEIPSEKALEMLAKAWELAGILVDEKR